MAVTIEDVARMAGCSITTVSRAYSAPQKVRESTRKKVYAAAEALHYSPNAIARAMVLQKNHSIAFVLHEKQSPIAQNPFYLALFEAVQNEAEKQGYYVYLTTAGDCEQAYELFMHKRVDGVIFAGRAGMRLLRLLHAQGMPIVLLNNQSEIEGIVSIRSDNYDGAVQAVKYLLDRGHRHIDLLMESFPSCIAASFRQAYVDTMAAHGFAALPQNIHTIEPGQHAIAYVGGLLQAQSPPSALLCMNDRLAVCALKAALRLGLQIPHALAVIGYNDSAFCRIFEPELTSVHVDAAAMGRRGTGILLGMIDGRQPETAYVQLGVTLAVRQST